MTPNDITALADAVDRLNKTINNSHWILWVILGGVILLFLIDRLYFFNKYKEISEERIKSLRKM